MLHLRSLLLPSAIGICGLGHASAQDPGATVEVHVRAESRIDLEWLDNQEPTLQGRIQDDLGRALKDREVSVEFVDRNDLRSEARAVADPDGYFWIVRPSGLSPPVRVRARFEGDDNYESTYVTLDSEHGGRKPQLRVRIADPIDLGEPEVEIELHLDWDDQAVRALTLVKNELGHRLAEQVVDGDVVLSVSSKLLGPPGDGRLIVETTATDQWGSRRTETPIRRRIRPTLSLTARLDDEEKLELCGELKDQFGALPDRIIEIHQRTQRIATLRTKSKGDFCLSEAAAADKSAEYIAKFAGDGRGRWPTESAPVTPRVPPKVERASWLGPLLTIVFGLIAWLLLSRRAKTNSAFEPDQKPPEAGVRTAKPKHPRADQFGVSLRVFALDSGQPLADTEVEFRSETGQQHSVHTNAEGWVSIERLDRGHWSLRVARDPGYLHESASLTVPHRGQWTNAEVFLRSVRQHADALWTELAAELSGQDVQGLTQREIARALPELRRASELAQDVELTTYASEPKSLGHLEELKNRADAVRALAEPANRSPQVPEK